MYQQNLFINLIHNGKNYRINQNVIISHSNLARSLLSNSYDETIRYYDTIEESIFSDLLNSMENEPDTYNNPIQLLQAAIIWNCPTISESIQNFLVNTQNDCDSIISTLHIRLNNNQFLEIIEQYIANNLQKFIDVDNFSQVDPFIIFRIITWHKIEGINSTVLFNFFCSVHQNFPGISSFLFNLIDLTMIPFDNLCSLLHSDGFDATVVSDQLQVVLKNEQQKLMEFQAHHLEAQNKAIMRLRKEKNRLVSLCEKAENNYNDAIARFDNLKRALNEQQTPIIDFDLTVAEDELRRLKYDKERSIKKLKKLQDESEKLRDEMLNQAALFYNRP